MASMSFSLPYPPSVNTYWRNNRGRTHISNKGRQYRQDVTLALLEQFGAQWLNDNLITGRVRLSIVACCPDRRRRDIDNIIKATLDAITHAELWQDDCQVDDLRVWRGPVISPGGCLELELETIAGDSDTAA